ncbi:hypothetical protein [Enterococcus sp. LJL51]|uniref:hypothetical protein n=1 Tax=Enterococcus sp. LJL51 TaxID=3416656 RepID=UPI003CEAF4E1
MSIDMYLGPARTQSADVQAMGTAHQQGYEAVQKAAASFAADQILEAAAYTSAKDMFQAVILPLLQGGRLLSEAVAEACKSFPNKYLSVDSGDLKSSELEEKIQRLNNEINAYNAIRISIESKDIGDNMKLRQLNANQKVINGLEDAKTELENKLEKLLEFHASSPALFAEISELTSAVNQGAAASNSSWNAATGTFQKPSGSSMDWVKKVHKMQQVRQLKKERSDLIDKINEVLLYDMEHPEHAQKTDKFLSPVDFLAQVEIKHMMYTAEEPYRTLCLRYLDRLSITDTIYKPKAGVFSWYADGTQDLKFDLNGDRFNRGGQGKYWIFFHELGHAIDFYYGRDKGLSGYYSLYHKENGLTLDDYNKLDVQNNLSQSIDELLKNSNYSNQQAIKQELMGVLLDPVIKAESLTGDIKNIYDTLQNKYEYEYLNRPSSFLVGDIYSGVTNFDIKGFHVGHTKDYFFDSTGTPLHPTGTEGFGSYFGHHMVKEHFSEQALDTTQKYLPESTTHMDTILNQMK